MLNSSSASNAFAKLQSLLQNDSAQTTKLQELIKQQGLDETWTLETCKRLATGLQKALQAIQTKNGGVIMGLYE